MTLAKPITSSVGTERLPDHTQLPCEDGSFVKNFQEHPQSLILTDSIGPVLERIHPDGHYAIGQDSGIYWRQTEPPQKGAEAPDWFYVPNVPPLLNGQMRRSYVLWQEHIAPLIVLEFASGDGSEERDRTPLLRNEDNTITKPGKFWVYEQVIRIPYYGIYIIGEGILEMYHLEDNHYVHITPNERGHYAIEPLGVELGLWEGNYQNQHQLWMRWWDNQGNLLLTGMERAERESQRADQERERAQWERERAQQERERAERAERSQQEAIPKLQAAGFSVEQIADTLNLPLEQVRQWTTPHT